MMLRKTHRQGGPRQKPFVGLWLQFLSVIGCFVLLAVLYFLVDRPTTTTGWWSAAEAILFIVLITGVVGVLGYLLERGDRHLAPSGVDVMRHDRRAPVLYLRPFEAESVLSVEERTLARILQKEVGPLVAVGDPQDTLPPLGAARFYERDFTGSGRGWQLFVREMLPRARLVLVVPGRTLGLAWEMAQCREVLAPQRLIVLVRGSPKSYDAFRGIAAQAGLMLPQIGAGDFGWGGETDFIGLVAFASDWTAHFSAFPEPPLFEDNGVDRRESRLRRGLEAALCRLGVTIEQL